MPATQRVLAAAAVGVLLAAVSARAPAAAAPPTTQRLTLPAGAYQLAPSRHAMWAVRADDTHRVLIFRIRPRTDRAGRVAQLPFAGGGFTFGFGSLWISDYYGNALWRVSPTGTVLQRIPVGLQPEAVHVAFGSVWVANHHGQSLTRIDPRSDGVVATDSAGDPGVFRSGPQGMTAGDGRLFVGSSDLSDLQWIDPATDLTTTAATTDDVFCGALVWAGEHVWSQDNCTNALYQFDADGAVTWSHSYGDPSGSDVAQIGGADRLGGALWVAVDRHFDENTGRGRGAVLEKRNPSTGAVLGRVPVGGDASGGAYAGHGSIWVSDPGNGRITRVTP